MQRDPYPRDYEYDVSPRTEFTWARSFIFGWWFAWGFTAALAAPWAIAVVVTIAVVSAASD